MLSMIMAAYAIGSNIVCFRINAVDITLCCCYYVTAALLLQVYQVVQQQLHHLVIWHNPTLSYCSMVTSHKILLL